MLQKLKITAADVGSRVRMDNGKIHEIVYYDRFDTTYPVNLSNDEWYTESGQRAAGTHPNITEVLVPLNITEGDVGRIAVLSDGTETEIIEFNEYEEYPVVTADHFTYATDGRWHDGDYAEPDIVALKDPKPAEEETKPEAPTLVPPMTPNERQLFQYAGMVAVLQKRIEILRITY